ncbi:uncharacterized protein LOC126377553 isoform X2 [Pectinophora gossypiella]|uniref:uncharacterized protein LOC126377553 isoform X2 n=1 Tax=Pectinophora gossypiella TaxID=13191 RepID=UPI00214F2D02|nr:uncharacterized protein LOC126377553 isoform X2 [Pectinophora gossypiella]
MRNTTCGIDKSPTKIFKEGTSIIQYYPWMGYLIYPLELRPICAPPTHFIDPEFFAMSFATDCSDSDIRLHRMRYVDFRDCQQYYDNKGLVQQRLWPTHSACAKALDRIACVWRSGTVLVVYQGGRWLLLGFGVYGPGCSEPARFIDYGMYHSWVKTSIARIGRAAITRLGPSHLVMRRTASTIQRFGPCDVEEMTTEIYTDMTNVTVMPCFDFKNIKYNVTLYAHVEYSCVTFDVDYLVGGSNTPFLYLRRWCFGENRMCHELDVLQIDFYVEVYFAVSAIVRVAAYGRQPKFIDPKKAMERTNVWSRKRPVVTKSTKDLSFLGVNLNWYFKTPWPSYESTTTERSTTTGSDTTTTGTGLRYYDIVDPPPLKRADPGR